MTGPEANGLRRALILSLAAAAIPVIGAAFFPASLQDYEALTWLVLLVPAFLWAYERGWRGAATALAAGMATLSVTYALMELRGGTIPDLLLAVIVLYIAISLGIGLLGERLAQSRRSEFADTLSLQDPLTGLPNRTHADLHLRIEHAAAERGRALAVILFDIDDLDDYNARHGTVAGDTVLKTVAELLRQQTRRMDLAARYAQDTFVSALGGCTEEGAVIFAARLQEQIRAAQSGVPMPTVSAGIACYRPETATAADMVEQARHALKQAGQEGGDRVRIHGRDLHELDPAEDAAARSDDLETARAAAAAVISSVQLELRDPGASPIGKGRSAFVLAGDAAVRRHLAEFLRAERFHVVECAGVAESIGHLQQEYDVALLEIAAHATGVADLIRQIRSRSPLTRVVGIPRESDGSLSTAVLDIRVDRHLLADSTPAIMRARIAELLQERDSLKTVHLRQRELSNELRAQQRQSRAALEASGEYFRSLVEHAADMIAVINRDGTVRYISPAVERVLGFAPAELTGRDINGWIHPADIEELAHTLRRLIDEPGAIRTTQTRARHADGSWRALEATCRNQLDTPGVDGVVINARDVTERQRAERALRESEELLLRAQKMESIGRLAGGVAHDFNNLLTAIQGHADLLMSELDDASPIRGDLTEIREAAGRATALTRQLLAFSRKQVMQPRVLDLNAVVADMEKMLRRVIGGQVTLETDLRPDAGRVRADPTQIEQVLLNLIVNARDAMTDGGRVTIETMRHTVGPRHRLAGEIASGTYALLRVTDSGSGMTAAVAANAFEPFFTTKAPGHGTGLGLSTVYGIVKQSGGHVWLRSEPDGGTEVNVLLPGVEDAADERVIHLPLETSRRGGGTETILLVEDEKSVRDLTTRILRREGYDVLVAENGRVALDLLNSDGRHIDLLLTDVVMPELNGQDLAEAVLRGRPGTPVLFMSGYNEEAVLRDGVLAEGALFLEKPFSPAALLDLVRNLLDGDAVRA